MVTMCIIAISIRMDIFLIDIPFTCLRPCGLFYFNDLIYRGPRRGLKSSMLETLKANPWSSRPRMVWKAKEIQGWNLRLVYYLYY